MTDPEEHKAKFDSELTPEQAMKFALETITRYQELADGLSEARTYLHSSKDRPPDRRRAFLHATAMVVQFLQRTSFFIQKGVEEPLTQLLYELHTVVMGIPSEDFTVRPGTRSRGTRYQTYQMECALAVDSYHRAGLPLRSACQRVVQLARASMSADTLKDWRNDLSNSKLEGEFGRLYRELRDEYSRVKFSIELLDAAVVDIGRRNKGLAVKPKRPKAGDIRKQSRRKTARKPRKLSAE